MTLEKLSVGTENKGTPSKLFKLTFASSNGSDMVLYSYNEFKIIVSFLLNSNFHIIVNHDLTWFL